MPVNAAETSVELTWLAPVTAWLALQPDLQYVIHPDTETRLHNATVAQLRFELTF
jgi:porin